MKLRALLFVVLLPIFAGIPPTQAASRVAPEQFMISFWCAPPPEETTLARYQEIAEAGFNTVLPPCAVPITPAFNRRVLQLCALTGLKAIISDPRLDAQVASPDAGLNAALNGVVADYAGSPALLGYFLRDEPEVARFPALAALNYGLQVRDPRRLPYINLFPNYATPDQMGAPSYSAYVNGFLQMVRPKLLSFDHYALFQTGERPNFFENLETIRRGALQAGVPFAYILMVSPHLPYRDPSEGDVRWQVYSALAYGARGILYFTYWMPHFGPVPFSDAIVDDWGRRTAHYDQVQRVNGELSALAPTLVQLRSTGVYHTGTLPAGTQGLQPGGIVQSVAGGDAVVGLFQGPRTVLSGSGLAQPPTGDYLLLANRNSASAVRLRVTLRADMAAIAEISRSTGQPGSPQWPDTFGNSFSITLNPGDGRLFALFPGQGAQPPVTGQGGQPLTMGRRWRMILGQ